MTDWARKHWLPLLAGALLALAIYTKAWTWAIPSILALLGEGGRIMKEDGGSNEGSGGSETPERPPARQAETSDDVDREVSGATSDVSNSKSEGELANELDSLADDLESQRKDE
jgi:hypothetical protein